jgi:hypothetical protein
VYSVLCMAIIKCKDVVPVFLMHKVHLTITLIGEDNCIPSANNNRVFMATGWLMIMVFELGSRVLSNT